MLIVRLFFLLLDLHDVKKGDLINVNRYVNLVISGTLFERGSKSEDSGSKWRKRS